MCPAERKMIYCVMFYGEGDVFVCAEMLQTVSTADVSPQLSQLMREEKEAF